MSDRQENGRLREGLRRLRNQDYDSGYTAESYADAILSGYEPSGEATMTECDDEAAAIRRGIERAVQRGEVSRDAVTPLTEDGDVYEAEVIEVTDIADPRRNPDAIVSLPTEGDDE